MVTTLSLSVISVTDSAAEVRVSGEAETIELRFKHYARGVIFSIPHAAKDRLSAHGRFEMLKHKLQPHFRGIRIETRTEPEPAWTQAAENRAADTSEMPVSNRE